MYQQFFDDRKFEERISMKMTGKVISTTSKKCKASMSAIFEIKPNKDWYERDRISEDLNTIGIINLEKADSEIYQEDTICFWASVPTKSFEYMKDYLTYCRKAKITLHGTETHYRKGEIYSLEFGELNT